MLIDLYSPIAPCLRPGIPFAASHDVLGLTASKSPASAMKRAFNHLLTSKKVVSGWSATNREVIKTRLSKRPLLEGPAGGLAIVLVYEPFGLGAWVHPHGGDQHHVNDVRRTNDIVDHSPKYARSHPRLGGAPRQPGVASRAATLNVPADVAVFSDAGEQSDGVNGA
jgi:hypothetical protein